MYVNHEYYQELINKHLREQKMASLGMLICGMQFEFKSDRKRQKFSEKYSKMKDSDLSVMRDKKKDLMKALFTVDNIKLMEDKELLDKIARNAKFIKLEITLEEAETMIEAIKKDAKGAYMQYASDYVRATANLEERSRKYAELKAQQKDSEKEEFRNINSDYREPIKESKVKEERKKEIDAKIDEMTTRKTTPYGISTEIEDDIKVLYPELDSNNMYYSTDTLVRSIKIENYSNKGKIQIQDIMEMALQVTEVIARELLFNSNSDVNCELFDKLSVNKSFDKYVEAYNKYMNYYNSLNNIEQDKINMLIGKNEEYVELYGKYIVTPELMRKKINEVVSDYILSNRDTYYEDNEFYNKTRHATQLMEPDKLKELYKNIQRYKQEDRGYYLRREDEIETFETRKQAYLEKMQIDFARVMLEKLESYNKDKNRFILSKENEKERDLKIIAVCRDCFNDEILSPYFANLAKENDTSGILRDLSGTYSAKKVAKDRIYDISNIEKTMAKISGKWSKYLMLMDKDTLTKEEQDELMVMFRR